MRNILTIIPFGVCLITLAGCTSKPREVTASIPLVSSSQEKPNKKEIPSQYWDFLSDSKQTSFAHDRYQVQLADLYTSALGLACRELTLVDKENNEEKRTACEILFVNENNQQDKAWFLEKQIIESRVYVEL
jgi:hypothetical protein